MRKLGRWCAVLAFACGLFNVPAALAAPHSGSFVTQFTWTGGATASGWSTGGNWIGGHAPGGAAAKLTFPSLSNCAGGKACYESNDNFSGFKMAALDIDDDVGPNTGYNIYGQPFTLGLPGNSLNGLVATATSTAGTGGATIHNAITLGAPQTWSVTGGTLSLGMVSGSGDALAIKLAQEGNLHLSANVEVGPITVSGLGYILAETGAHSSSMNATDHNQLTISQSALQTFNASLGPLKMTHGYLIDGYFNNEPTGSMEVNGSLALNSTGVYMYINAPGTAAGNDYSSIGAEGNVTVSAGLTLDGGAPNGNCPGLHKGDVDTLINAMGTITGTFNGVPNGATIHLSCTGSEPTLKIQYNPHTVTATVATAPAEAAVCDQVNVTTTKNTAKTIKFNCPENSAEKLTYAIVTSPAHGKLGPINQTTGTVSYTPNLGYTGSDSFEYRATNAQGASNIATASIDTKS